MIEKIRSIQKGNDNFGYDISLAHNIKVVYIKQKFRMI